MKKNSPGFTLIELLIALAIFAIMAMIISSVLYTVFQARDRVNQHSDRLAQLQFAIVLMQRDFEQISMRKITDENNYTSGALLGDETQLEFTRAGFINPLFQEQRSTLQRVAYSVKDNNLYRQSWQSLDRKNDTKSEKRVLLEHIKQLNFGYLTAENQVQHNWSSLRDRGLPRAIQVNLQLSDWGNMSLLFAIPSGVKPKTRG